MKKSSTVEDNSEEKPSAPNLGIIISIIIGMIFVAIVIYKINIRSLAFSGAGGLFLGLALYLTDKKDSVLASVIIPVLISFSGISMLLGVSSLLNGSYLFLKGNYNIISLLGIFFVSCGALISLFGIPVMNTDNISKKGPLPELLGKSFYLFLIPLLAFLLSLLARSLVLPKVSFVSIFPQISKIITSDIGFLAFCVILLFTYISIRSALKSLPISHLIPRSKEKQYNKIFNYIQRTIIAIILILVALLGVLEYLSLPEGVTSYLFFLRILLNPIISQSMILTIIFSLLVCLILGLTKLFTRKSEKEIGSPISILITATVFSAISWAYGDQIIQLLNSNFLQFILSNLTISNQHIALLFPVSAFIVPLTFLFIALISKLIGIIPEKSGASSLVALGVFVTAIGGYLIEIQGILFFSGIALSLIIWELGRYSTELDNQIGEPGFLKRNELVHDLSTIFVGLAGIGIAYIALNFLDNAWLHGLKNPRLFLILSASFLSLLFLSKAAGKTESLGVPKSKFTEIDANPYRKKYSEDIDIEKVDNLIKEENEREEKETIFDKMAEKAARA